MVLIKMGFPSTKDFRLKRKMLSLSNINSLLLAFNSAYISSLDISMGMPLITTLRYTKYHVDSKFGFLNEPAMALSAASPPGK